MATTILPYRNLGETLGVHLDLDGVPHKRTGEFSLIVDRAATGKEIEIGIDVQVPAGIKTTFPPHEHKTPPLEVLATVMSIDGGIREPLALKQKKTNLYTGKIKLDLSRITESARIRAYAVRGKDGSSAGFASKKGSRLAWGPETEIRFTERPPKGNFLNTVWEDFSDSDHVPRHFDDAMYYIDAGAEPPILYLNKLASAPLIKLIDTEGQGHPRALPRDLIFRSIATDAWLTLAQITLGELHKEAEDGSSVDIGELFEGSWKKEFVELLAPALYPNLMEEEALLELGQKIGEQKFYMDALLKAPLAIQVGQKIRDYYEQFAAKVFENA